LDASRQWGVSLNEIRRDHTKRYEFAAKYAKGRVLDAACGCGYGSSILFDVTKNVVGVDNSDDAIAWARARFPGPSYIIGSIEKEPWGGTFETVVSLETIEHIKEPQGALQAFRRACLGTLIVSTPNEDLYPFVPETFANDESPHFRHYKPSEFDELLSSNGFKVISRHCQKTKRDPEISEGIDGVFLIYVCE